MSKNRNIKRRRDKLWRKDPYCFWCGVETVFPVADREVYKKIPKHLRHPDNEATLDHIRSRLDPERIKSEPDKKRLVLSCQKCNKMRSIQEVSSLSINEVRKRSGCYPECIYPIL